jgi:hypothetical protein
MRRLVLLVLPFVFFLTSAAAAPPGLPPQPRVRPSWMPAGAVLVSPCVPHMGRHWANPKNLPFGPIYGEYNGKPVFTEVMILKSDFAKGKSWMNILHPLPGTRIDHVDIEYEPHGHPGFLFPHYDIHAYFVSASVENGFCPNG